MKNAKKSSDEFFTYKGIPLVRCGNVIYYGSMKDKFVIKMEIKSQKEVSGIKVADSVSIQLLDTNPDISSRKKIVKVSEKGGLYPAIDIAGVWLNRALEG